MKTENKKNIECKFYDRDKLQVVHYIDISNIDEDDVPAYIEEIANAFKGDESVNSYFIPVRGEHVPMIEFHWPPYRPDGITVLESNFEPDED